MSKQALHFMIDVGNAIDKNYSNSSDCSRLKLALNCFALTLQQKLVNNPTHEFGFSIFGDNDSDDGNNQLLYPIQKPNLDLVRKVKQMSQTNLSNDKQGGDIFSAIQHIILIFRDYIGKKKYNKRAFLFTAGYGPTTYQQSELKHIVANLQIDNIKLNIIPIDFLKNYNLFENTTKDQVYSNQNQRKNAELLMKLKSYGPDNVQIFTTQIAIQLYSKFRTKDTNPVVLFKGDLQIAPGFNLPVASFKCIRKQRLLSLGKYDVSVAFDPVLSKEKQIFNDITFVCQGDQSGSIVTPQNIVKAFPYGPNLVPINNIIQPSMKIYEEKNFKLLGFVDKDKIPRESFMGQMEIVVPFDTGKSREEMSIAKKLFTALIYSMKQNKKYAVARYVPRNSKSGVNPRLVGLIPNISGQKIMLYLVDLPTVQDVRQYPFNSLKKANQKQKQLVQQLVDKMSLIQIDEDGQQIDKLKNQNTFNPVRQYFFQTVFHRAMQNETQIPILDPIIKQYITPQLKIYQQTKNVTTQIKTEFKMTLKQLAKQKIAQQKTLRWMDILSTNRDTDQYSEASYQMPVKKFNLQQNKDEEFNPLKPIQSFRDMLNNNRKDLVDQALLEMSQYIQKKSLNISSAQDIQHLIQCSMKLRQGCIEQKQTQFWDNWFETLKDKIGKTIPDRLKQRGYGFISTKRNTLYYKAETFNPVNIAVADDLD